MKRMSGNFIKYILKHGKEALDSPTLFEDAVKSILLCNCKWTRTLEMARALCELQFELTHGLVQEKKDITMNTGEVKLRVKRKQPTKTSSSDAKKSAPLLGLGGESKALGDFPSAKELSGVSEEFLKGLCKLGYRAGRILNLARNVESNKVRLEDFEKVLNMTSSSELYKKLLKVNGFGPFVCANVLMCIGFYERIPEDSETIRHLSEYHKTENRNKKTRGGIVKEISGKYAPFQCLAYCHMDLVKLLLDNGLELVEYYESKLGSLSKLPSSSYSMVNGSIDKKINESK